MRAFLATPEVRPEGVTVSRRRPLAGAGAAVAVTVLAAPSLSEGITMTAIPSPAATHPDVELLAAFSAWVAIQREMERAGDMNDDDFAVICGMGDDAAHHTMTFVPVTAVGMAIQFHLVAHLAFGMKRGDYTEANFDDREDDLRVMAPMFRRASEMTASLRAGGVA